MQRRHHNERILSVCGLLFLSAICQWTQYADALLLFAWSLWSSCTSACFGCKVSFLTETSLLTKQHNSDILLRNTGNGQQNSLQPPSACFYLALIAEHLQQIIASQGSGEEQHPDGPRKNLSVMLHASFAKPLHFNTWTTISSCCLRLHIPLLGTLKLKSCRWDRGFLNKAILCYKNACANYLRSPCLFVVLCREAIQKVTKEVLFWGYTNKCNKYFEIEDCRETV